MRVGCCNPEFRKSSSNNESASIISSTDLNSSQASDDSVNLSRSSSSAKINPGPKAQNINAMPPTKKCKYLNSRLLLREESVEHTNKNYHIFAKNKRRVNQEILEHGMGKEPVICWSPQPIREYDYSNPICIQFVKSKNSKIRIIKSSNELKLPDGIAEARLFVDFVKLYQSDKDAAKSLSLQSLLEQADEIESLKKKILELESNLKRAKVESAEPKKNPFAQQPASKPAPAAAEEGKMQFCKKCRDILTDEDRKSDDAVNKELLEYNEKLKKKITGVGLLKALTQSSSGLL